MRLPIASVTRRAPARSLAASLQVGSSATCSSLVRWSQGAAELLSSLSSSASRVELGGLNKGCCYTATCTASRRWQSSGVSLGWGAKAIEGDELEGGSFSTEDSAGLHSELAHELEGEGNLSHDAALSQPLGKADLQTPTARISLEKIERPPGRFDMLTNSLVYRWQTTAKYARKVTGPMREWASELKYRTGVHIEVEPTFPERAMVPEADGGYTTADEVELTLYLFGSERGIFNCRQLMEAALDQNPAYVRLGVFRRKPGKTASSDATQNSSASNGGSATVNPNEDIEWLMLRRINRDLRPPDIPPISLKLPGKWTLLFEHYKEAAVRSLWEETGITVDPNTVFPTACLSQNNPEFYWRVPVHYFVAEVPYDVEVRGPQTGQNTYMHHWDAQLLRQSPDPIDRAWAQLADPETGCAWMKVPMIDELQRPLRGKDYMTTRYTPPPYSGLNDVLGFAVPAEESAAAADTVGAADATAAAAVEEKDVVAEVSAAAEEASVSPPPSEPASTS